MVICSSGSYLQHLHSFFMRLEALLLMVFGKSIWSMPRMVSVRTFIGSKPSNGSLETKTSANSHHFYPQLEKFVWNVRLNKTVKPTRHSEVQTQKHPVPRGLQMYCGLYSGWFQGPYIQEYRRTSKFSYPLQSSLHTWSQSKKGRYQFGKNSIDYHSIIKMWSKLHYQFGISTLIQNNIFRLDISIDDTSTVKKGQGLDNTSSVEPGDAFIQTASETVCTRLIWMCSVGRRKTSVLKLHCVESLEKNIQGRDSKYFISMMTKSAFSLNFL